MDDTRDERLQIRKARKLDRATLLYNSGSKTKDQGRGEWVPYHPALNGLGVTAGKLQSMLSHSDEHRKLFPATPIIAFRRCKNLKDILVRARVSNQGQGGTHTNGCSGCGKARCQVCNVISNCDSFKS